MSPVSLVFHTAITVIIGHRRNHFAIYTSRRAHPHVSGQRRIPTSFLCPTTVLFSLAHSCYSVLTLLDINSYNFCNYVLFFIFCQFKIASQCSLKPNCVHCTALKSGRNQSFFHFYFQFFSYTFFCLFFSSMFKG